MRGQKTLRWVLQAPPGPGLCQCNSNSKRCLGQITISWNQLELQRQHCKAPYHTSLPNVGEKLPSASYSSNDTGVVCSTKEDLHGLWAEVPSAGRNKLTVTHDEASLAEPWRKKLPQSVMGVNAEPGVDCEIRATALTASTYLSIQPR